MPRGARRQFALLQENCVGPSFVGKVVQQTDAHCPAADDCYLDFVVHFASVSSISTDDVLVTF